MNWKQKREKLTELETWFAMNNLKLNSEKKIEFFKKLDT